MLRIVHMTAAGLLLLASAALAQTPTTGSSPAVENGSIVSIEYTLSSDAGEVLDTNRGAAPLTFTQGQQQIIPGLEREMIGLRAGDQKKVVVKPEDGYGEVVPNAQQEVPKEAIPKEGLRVGTALTARSGSGEVHPVVVKEIRENTVIIDFNHPLAGKTLFFDVKVLGVEPPQAAPAAPSR